MRRKDYIDNLKKIKRIDSEKKAVYRRLIRIANKKAAIINIRYFG